MPTQITVTYTIPRTHQSLASQIAAVETVEIPEGDLTKRGLKLLSESVEVLGTSQIVRTVLLAPEDENSFQKNFPTESAKKSVIVGLLKNRLNIKLQTGPIFEEISITEVP